MLDDFKILHFDKHPFCKSQIDKCYDGYYSFQLNARGTTKLCIAQERFTLGPGSFWGCYPGPRIQFSPLEDGETWSHRYIAFKGSLVQRWISLGIFPHKPVSLVDFSPWAELFDQFLEWATIGDCYNTLKVANGLERIFIHLSQYQRVQNLPSWLEPLLNYFESCEYQNLDYSKAAQISMMGLSTLRRKFKDLMGEPIHAYIIRKRIDKACQLLQQKHLRLEAIAYQLKYSDLSFFARQFQEVMGISPGKFRKSLEEMHGDKE